MKHYRTFNKKYHNEDTTLERPVINYLGLKLALNFLFSLELYILECQKHYLHGSVGVLHPGNIFFVLTMVKSKFPEIKAK